MTSGPLKAWCKALGHAVASSLAKVLLVAAIALLNPFDVLHWSERHSFEAWEHVFAPSYPAARWRPQPDQPNGRNALTVVYVDDLSLAEADASWPLSFDDQGLILEDLCHVAREGPAAIFVDFTFGGHSPTPERLAQLFEHAPTAQCAGRREIKGGAGVTPPNPAAEPKPSERTPFEGYLMVIASITHYSAWANDQGCARNPLTKLHCILKSGGTPVIFADPEDVEAEKGSRETPSSARASPLVALDRIALTAPVGLSSEDYALVWPPVRDRRDTNGFKLTPAALLYAVYCERVPSPCTASPVVTPNPQIDAATPLEHPPTWSSRFDSPLYVEWGVGRPDAFSNDLDMLSNDRLDERCRVGSRLIYQAAWRTLETVFTGIHLQRRAANCPYAHALPVSELDRRGVWSKLIDEAIAGKLILFGGHFRQGGDWVASPVQGAVPGIDYHAMALDNLIERGDRYPREAVPVFSAVDLHWGKVIEILVVLVVALAFRVVRITDNGYRLTSTSPTVAGAAKVAETDLAHALRLAAIWLAIVGPTVAAAYGVARANNLSPLNWLGVFLASLPWFPDAASDWLEMLIEKSGMTEGLAFARPLIAWASIEGVTWSGAPENDRETQAMREHSQEAEPKKPQPVASNTVDGDPKIDPNAGATNLEKT